VDCVIIDAGEHIGEQACGSTSLSFAVMINVAMTAARSAPRSEPANTQMYGLPRRVAAAILICYD
jgi:hypothetical protein